MRGRCLDWKIQYILFAHFRAILYRLILGVRGATYNRFWEETGLPLAFPMCVSSFKCVALFRNYTALKAKLRPNISIFTPSYFKKWGKEWASWAKYMTQEGQSSVLHEGCFRIPIGCCVSKAERLRSKIEAKLRTFWHPLKFMEGWWNLWVNFTSSV